MPLTHSSPIFIVLFLFFVRSVNLEALTEAALITPADTTTTDIPQIGLHIASTGRLPLRRQVSEKLRDRRGNTVKSRAGRDGTAAPTEGALYDNGEFLSATDPRPLALSCDRASAARAEACLHHRYLLLRLSSNLEPADSRSITNMARAYILRQSGLSAAEVALVEADYQQSLALYSNTIDGDAGKRFHGGHTTAPIRPR